MVQPCSNAELHPEPLRHQHGPSQRLEKPPLALPPCLAGFISGCTIHLASHINSDVAFQLSAGIFQL